MRHHASPSAQDRPFVIDVSRMIWRRWSGRLPTGIDRVCLAYMAHYGPRALALVQRGGIRLILSPRGSDALFRLLQAEHRAFRCGLMWLLARAALHPSADARGKIYLNVGHTGLDAPSLPAWLSTQGLRPVFLVHDLIPLSHPHFCRSGEARRHIARMRHLLQSAHGIIANSHDTLNHLCTFAEREALPIPSARTVAWLGAPPPLPISHAAPNTPYFAMVGTIEARKNHLLLLQVWRQLAAEMGERTPHLFLIGQRGWEAQAVFDLLDTDPLIRATVHELGHCPDERMAALLSGACALLMPSHAEGYGLPVIEALQLGCPVIASDLAVFREIAGDVPCYIPADAADAWRLAVLHYLSHGADRQRQLQALATFTPPNWEAHFKHIDAWLDDLRAS